MGSSGKGDSTRETNQHHTLIQDIKHHIIQTITTACHVFCFSNGSLLKDEAVTYYTYQSSGFSEVGSGIISGSSSSQPRGFTASGSGICIGASSSQSSGLVASGSGIFSLSSQSFGMKSSGSSISLGGLTGGEKSSRRLPELITYKRSV